ncbi:MAG: DUF1553 domain-containing protein [Planctomycetales bacterium]|nr:DUF1553 domain-containing protein [Planctomycetales bacterium]
MPFPKCQYRWAQLSLGFIVVGFLAVPLAAQRPVSFELDVQPVLTKAGCNSGACHGKQRGQNGFQLSLLAFDPDFDYAAVARDGRGRRIFPAAAAQSLLLRKALAELPHGGGQRFTADSAEYHTLLTWISQGAPRTAPGEPTLERVALAQSSFSLTPNETQPLEVYAYYSDGSERNVTAASNYLANEASVLDVDEQGHMTAGELPGETAVMVRYMNHICVADVVIPQSSAVPSEFYEQLPRENFIDDLVLAKLEKTGVVPSSPASEATFLRRVYTDLIGRLPSVAEAQQFLDSQAPDKREQLVDGLLQRGEYVDHWANQWADLLRPNPYRVGIKAVLNYDHWIRQQFRDDVPYDRLVRSLVTAKGSTWRNGAVTLYRDRRTPDEMATLISQLFLGVRLECAKCHHHPFEKWSQADFYHFAAFFARVKHKGTGLSPPISGGEETIFVSTKGEVRHPLTDAVLPPRPLFGQAPLEDDSRDPREALAAWITSPENDYFSQVQVNRVWATLMGRGLVEPVDDLRSTNPPSNPELLQALANHFRDSGYDTKGLLKTIALSRTYALSSMPTESNLGDRLNYSRHYRHRLRAEVLLDAITDVTETPANMSGMPFGSRANQIWTHRVGSMFLDTFGRPDENQDPPCERTSDSTVTQALHLMNSVELDARIRSNAGRAKRLAASSLEPAEIVRELYLAVFSRYPQAEELTYASELISQAGEDRRTVIEDLLWAMLNAPEFSIQN